MTLVVASYLSPRPAEYGDRAHTYSEPLLLLEASCAKANCTHVVLTEEGSVEAIPSQIDRSRVYAMSGTDKLPLMQAIIAGQMTYIRDEGVPDEGLILVGADCLIMRDPRPVFEAADWDVGVTVGVYSPGALNNGAVYVPPQARTAATRFYEMANSVCRPEWGGDQQAVREICLPLLKPPAIAEWGGDQESVRRACAPLMKPPATEERNGVMVRFFDMDTHNCPPAGPQDYGSTQSYVTHFKGPRKDFMAAYALRHLGIERPFVVP